MRVLLVFPPVTAKERVSWGLRRVFHPIEPLGLAYIAAVLEQHNIPVRILDCYALDMTVEQLRRDVLRWRPDVIGVYTLSMTHHRTLQIAQLIKETIPSTFLVFGGPHASALPIQTLRDTPSVDAVVIGEGEYTMLELVRHLDHDGGLTTVNGIAYRQGPEIVTAPPREPITLLDDLPFPARHLLPMRGYGRPTFHRRVPVISMITSRGCPFRCTYCSKAVFEPTYRVRSVARAARWIYV